MTTQLLRHIEEMTDFVQFERLCSDALSLMGYLGIDPQGIGRRDGGKDALLNHPQFGKVVFHFSLRLDWERKLKEDIETVRRNRLPCDQFIFFTNRKVSALAKDNSKIYCKDQLHCELEIFDQERLRAILSSNDQICATYFPNYFVATDTVSRLVTTLNKLVDQGLQIPHEERLRTAPRFILESTQELSQLASTGYIDDVLSKTSGIVEAANKSQFAAAEGLFCVACLCFERGELGAAEIIWENVLRIDSAHFGANFNLGILMEHDKKGRRYGYGFRAQEAINFFNKALSITQDHKQKADCLDNQGVIFVHLMKVEQAQQKFKEAQNICPNHLSSKLNCGTVAKDWKTAERIYKSLLNTSKSDFAHINLASAYLHQGKLGKSLGILRKFKRRKKWAESYLILSEISLERKKQRKAQLYAEKALLIDVNNWDAHLKLGKALKAQARFEDAVHAFEASIEIQPDRAFVYLELADALQNQGLKKHTDRIIECLKNAIRIDPSIKNARNNLGEVYFENGMYASARKEYQNELEIHPDNEQAYFRLGYMTEYNNVGIHYGSRSCLRNAIAYYRKALEHDSDYFPALFNLGTALLQLGSHDEAIIVLEKSVEISPKSDIALSNLASAYAGIGKMDNAVKFWRKAFDINNDNQYALSNLIQAALL